MDRNHSSHATRNVSGSSHKNSSSASSSGPIPSSSMYIEWKKFFVSAGIPATVASTYADTFADHRIQMDMLKEITKDILIDMGIKAMGDIIAILRQAKSLSLKEDLKISLASTNQGANLQDEPQTTISKLTPKAPFSWSAVAAVQQQHQQTIAQPSRSVPTTLSAFTKRPTSPASRMTIAKRLKPSPQEIVGNNRHAAPLFTSSSTSRSLSIHDRLDRRPGEIKSFVSTSNNKPSSVPSKKSIKDRLGRSGSGQDIKPERLKSTVFARLGESKARR